jgi:hypothetical protein
MERFIGQVNDKLEVADFMMFRERSKLTFDEEFDEGVEFWNQMEAKLEELIHVVDEGASKGCK